VRRRWRRRCTTASLAVSVLPAQIELHADLDRSLPATDPEQRELRISCGAALLNLRLALQSHSIRPLVTLLPDGYLAGVGHGTSRGSRER
jgi:hypothetical protein